MNAGAFALALGKDYERKVQTSETLIEVAMIRLLVVRLGRQT
jgi:putative transposase